MMSVFKCSTKSTPIFTVIPGFRWRIALSLSTSNRPFFDFPQYTTFKRQIRNYRKIYIKKQKKKNTVKIRLFRIRLSLLFLRHFDTNIVIEARIVHHLYMLREIEIFLLILDVLAIITSFEVFNSYKGISDILPKYYTEASLAIEFIECND